MRLGHKTLLCLVFLCVLGGSISGAEAQMKIRWKGVIGSNLFLGLMPKGDVSNQDNLGQLFNYRNSNFLGFGLVAKLGDVITGKANVEVRNLNFSQATTSFDLENYNKNFPVSLRLNEAFIEFHGLLEIIDLTIGQQRIAWGATTVFNPTDNLNPFNLENPLDFQQRLPVPAIKAAFALGEHATLTLVNIPMYTPAILPISLFREVTTIDISTLVPKGFKLGQITSNEILQQPEFRVENMQAAARLAVEIDPVNFSLSYFYGRLFVPVPKRIPIINPGIDFATKTVRPLAQDVTLVFPRVHTIGADFSSSLFGVDVRAEVAVFIPVEAVEADITLRTDPKDPKSIVRVNPLTGKKLAVTGFKKEPFVKLVLEAEYTFPGGFHAILQYIYGFFNEQDWDKLHHYWMLTMRKTLFRGKLELRLVSGFELDITPTSGEKQDGKEPGYAFLVNGEMIWKPFDVGQIVLGGIVSRGTRGTTFRLFQSLAQVYLRAKMEFK